MGRTRQESTAKAIMETVRQLDEWNYLSKYENASTQANNKEGWEPNQFFPLNLQSIQELAAPYTIENRGKIKVKVEGQLK